MAEPIARAVEAIENYDVAYETTPTDTVIEAENLSELFAAVQAAHEAIAGEGRVVTELEIDYQPGREQRMNERVTAVQRELGRPPRSDNARGYGSSTQSRYQQGGPGRHGGGTAPLQSERASGSQGRTDSSRRYGSRRW